MIKIILSIIFLSILLSGCNTAKGTASGIKKDFQSITPNDNQSSNNNYSNQ